MILRIFITGLTFCCLYEMGQSSIFDYIAGLFCACVVGLLWHVYAERKKTGEL